MHIETQFSIFMVNKPGVLAHILGDFADAKINIIALTMMDSVEHGVMRVVTGSREKTRKILAKLNMPNNETDVLCVNMSNKSGALAIVTQKLSEAHINIIYAYCTAGARGGRTTGILKVSDIKKAMKVLEAKADQKAKSKKSVRKSPASRK